MIIRNETPSDIETIEQITKTAFEHDSFSCQTEHFTIRDLREADALTLSLVTEIDGRIVGHIAFSPVTISDGTLNWHCLGPVSVLPDYQGCGIGMALVRKGLALLDSMGGKGCVLVGLPIYHYRFGFRNYPGLIHEGIPWEVFSVLPLAGRVPNGMVERHPAFKQLSLVEKDAITDVIIDYDIGGAKIDPENPAIESLMDKGLLVQAPDGKFIMQPSAMAEYDDYFGRVAEFRATETNRVHKNPLMTAVQYGR